MQNLIEAPIGKKLINQNQLIPLTAPPLKLNQILVPQVTHYGGKFSSKRVVQTIQIILSFKSLHSHIPSKRKKPFINLGRCTLPNKPISIEPHCSRLNIRK
ncbi:hypothetical protein AAZX31_20G152400 [Glycine max]